MNELAINRLVNAGVLVQRNLGRQRYRVVEAPAVIDLVTSLERALASPTGNTATTGPRGASTPGTGSPSGPPP
ncbi:MAG: hypothetical protein ACRDT2_03555 [Natronosporangium sp.]